MRLCASRYTERQIYLAFSITRRMPVKTGILHKAKRGMTMKNIIETPCGQIRGCGCQWPGVTAFKGIRYATAGRFEYPQIVTHWDGEYDATAYGNCCYQPRSFYDEEQVPEKAFYYNEFRKGETYTYSEDCLFLNVWMPENATPESNLPVLFYIHGGGFTGGCGHEKHFDGPVWASKGIIAVTINYRLGPLGFLCLPELAAEAGHTGNYGLFDQLAALRWVSENITAFGGDAKNITLMGQSAGAMSVQQHLLSPLSRPYVAKAVMSSGCGVNKMFGSANPPEKSYDFWHQVMKAAGCGDLAAFRVLPAEDLFAAMDKMKKEQNVKGMFCAPCTDGVFTPKAPLDIVAAGEQADVPTMVGTNSEDMFPPILHNMAKGWCRTQYAAGKGPSYAYYFDRKLPGDKNGAWHSADLWYWFGTLKNGWRPFTEKDEELSDQMSGYLVNFARNGNPNGEGLPAWKPITKEQGKVLCLGEKETRMGKPGALKMYATMLTKKSVGE